MIIMQLSYNEFAHQFELHGRQHQFSSLALERLYEHLMEFNTPEHPYVLDVVGLCCEFTEIDAKDAEEYHAETRIRVDDDTYLLI